MKIKNQVIISLALSALMIFLGLSSASATESDWQNLNQNVESGLTGSAHNCNPLSVSHGSVDAYPSCMITCSSGYTLSGSACIVQSSGGGGGGGGGSSSGTANYCTAITYGDWQNVCYGTSQFRSVLTRTPADCTLTTAQQITLQRTCSLTATTTTTIDTGTTGTTGTTGDSVLENIATEAQIIGTNNRETLLMPLGAVASSTLEQAALLKYKTILGSDKTISAEEKMTISYFIVYGTPGTYRLGAGERAAVINSYYQAYGRLPNSEAEWSDVLKIASGRWPSERNTAAEARAKVEFKKVYARDAVMTNNIDENAIMVIAYGLLPLNRNLDSEKVAILTFKWVYGHNPVNALAWNVVRAIAYSGAKR